MRQGKSRRNPESQLNLGGNLKLSFTFSTAVDFIRRSNTRMERLEPYRVACVFYILFATAAKDYSKV